MRIEPRALSSYAMKAFPLSTYTGERLDSLHKCKKADAVQQ